MTMPPLPVVRVRHHPHTHKTNRSSKNTSNSTGTMLDNKRSSVQIFLLRLRKTIRLFLIHGPAVQIFIFTVCAVIIHFIFSILLFSSNQSLTKHNTIFSPNTKPKPVDVHAIHSPHQSDSFHSLQLPTSRLSSNASFRHRHSTFNYRQKDVRHVTSATYRAYMKSCLGRDEFDPATNLCHDWFNIGLTTLDTLDTLILMHLDEEYNESRQWAAKHLTFETMEESVSGFELIIRALAGLMSAHQLTGDRLWKHKAHKLADLLLPSFNVSKTGCMPQSIYVGKQHAEEQNTHGSFSDYASPADSGSTQLEIRAVGDLIGDVRFSKAVDKCIKTMIEKLPNTNRTVPVVFNVFNGDYSGSRETIGGNVDSFYEMMLKTWVAFGKRPDDDYLRYTFTSAVETTFKRLHGYNRGGFSFIGERAHGGALRQTMDHLVCFFPGVLSLAALHGLGGGRNGSKEDDYMPRARLLMKSCYEMTVGTKHGLVGEISSFESDHPSPLPGQLNCFLRPEIVESLFYLNLIDPEAGDKYKQWGWSFWQRMKLSAQVAGKPDGVWGPKTNIEGLLHIDVDEGGKLDSFVLAETLKYFFLLFDDRPLEDSPISPLTWVFNTEGHPIRITNR